MLADAEGQGRRARIELPSTRWDHAGRGGDHSQRKVNVALAPVPSCEPSRPVPATVRTPEDTQIRTDRLWCVGCEPRILPCAAEVVLERTRRYLLDVHRVESDGFVPAPDALIPGSRIVRLSGLDHAALALPWWSGTPVNPAPIVRALVVLAAG